MNKLKTKGCPELAAWVKDYNKYSGSIETVNGNCELLDYHWDDEEGLLCVDNESFIAADFKTFKEKVLDKVWTPTLKEGEQVNLHGISYSVMKSSCYEERYFLEACGGDNSVVFKELKIDKEEISLEVLGYRLGGGFPYCKSLEDLTKLVNYLKSYKMEQIRYILDKKEYIGAVGTIVEGSHWLLEETFKHNSLTHQRLSEAGVMHWFKEVEKEKSVEFNTPFKVVVRGGRAYHHNKEDITDFVKELVEYYHGTHRFGDPKRSAIVREVEFESTGCEKATSKLSDWVKIYVEMNEQTI